jgi:molecular chaperone IbpA
MLLLREDVAMTYDFSPLFRSSIGFDRIFDLLENAARLPQADNWPPYDIVKAGEDRYAITMAVAGFLPEELSITTEPNLLIVSGRKQGDRSGEYLHRGIAQRSFERRFELADYVKVVRASLDKGLLTLELQRDIPDEMKPRRIEIQSGTKAQKESGDLRQLEQDSQRAA